MPSLRLLKERKNVRKTSKWKCSFYLPNVFLWIQAHLVYLSALRLLTAVCEKLVRGKSDLAAVRGLTCIVQLQKERPFLHPGYRCCLKEGSFGSQPLYACSEMCNGEKKRRETATQSCNCPYISQNAWILTILPLYQRTRCRVQKSVVIFPPSHSKSIIFGMFYSILYKVSAHFFPCKLS